MDQCHKKYFLLYNNRKMMRKREVQEKDKPTFKPQLNQKSQKIVQSKQSPDRKNHYDRLIEAGKKVQIKNLQLR